MPRPTRLFLAGNTVSMAGTGLVIGFTLIYLHQVRGLALPVVGGLFAASAAAGLIMVPILGVLLDRLGARQVLIGILLGQAAADVLLAWVHNVATALPVMMLYGAAWAPMFPALQTMIAGLTPDPAARVLRRARRSYALVATGLILAVSWAVFGLAGLPITPADRIACVFGFTAVFGLGETVLAPTMVPLVNRLTDDRVRGRANSLAALSTSLAYIVSPALATGLIAAGAADVWIGLLCLGCLGTVAIGARLRRALTTEEDHVSLTPAPASAPTIPSAPPRQDRVDLDRP